MTRLAGLSGITFAVLFTTALVLMHRAPGIGVPDEAYIEFYHRGHRDPLVSVGLYIVPFAGIAFLWHMAATRSLIAARTRPSPLTSLLQLVAGAAFTVLVFAGVGAGGAIALLMQLSSDPLPSVEVARALSAVGYALMFVFGARFAGMYIATTIGLLRAAGLIPGPLVWLGYLTAAIALTQWTFHPVFAVIFPAWVFVVSITLIAVHTTPKTTPPTRETGTAAVAKD